MITINGIDFDVDMLDADTMEYMEKAVETTQAKIVEIQKKQKDYKASDYIKVLNGIIEDFLTDFLGEDSVDLIFQGSKSLMPHMKAYTELFDAVQSAYKEAADFGESLNAYSPNRAARRASLKAVAPNKS